MNEGFYTDVKAAALFFRFCARYRIEGKENRTLLLRELVRRKKARYLRDVQPIIAGKKVLKIVPKKERE